MNPIIIAAALALSPWSYVSDRGDGNERKRCGEYSNCGDSTGDRFNFDESPVKICIGNNACPPEEG